MGDAQQGRQVALFTALSEYPAQEHHHSTGDQKTFSDTMKLPGFQVQAMPVRHEFIENF